MAKKPYVDDYENVVKVDEEGNERMVAEYRGRYHVIVNTAEEMAGFKRLCIVLAGVMMAAHIGAGFINNPGMYQFYVSLPYVIAFFPMVYLVAGILRLPRKKERYQRDEIGVSHGRMKTAGTVLLALVVAGLLGGMVFLVFFALEGEGLVEIPYLALEAVVAGAVWLLRRAQRKIVIQEWEENHT